MPPDPIRGRWTLFNPDPRNSHRDYPRHYIEGPYTPKPVEVVPVPDEQAIERAATALYDLPPYTTLDEKVRAVLTAALEQPE